MGSQASVFTQKGPRLLLPPLPHLSAHCAACIQGESPPCLHRFLPRVQLCPPHPTFILSLSVGDHYCQFRDRWWIYGASVSEHFLLCLCIIQHSPTQEWMDTGFCLFPWTDAEIIPQTGNSQKYDCWDFVGEFKYSNLDLLKQEVETLSYGSEWYVWGGGGGWGGNLYQNITKYSFC